MISEPHRRSTLLHPCTGITDTNTGLDYAMVTVLEPYMKAQEQLQTTAQPIQHRVARILRKLTRFYEHIGLFEGNLADYEPYASWRDLMHVGAICKDEPRRYN